MSAFHVMLAVLVVGMLSACDAKQGGAAPMKQPPAPKKQPPAAAAAPTPTPPTTSAAPVVTAQAPAAPAGAPEPLPGDPVAGEEVFLSTGGCGACHALADAGTSGSIGPNLDQTEPSYDKVVDRVTNGKGAMPAFSGRLSEQQIQDVAAYVSTAAGS